MQKNGVVWVEIYVAKLRRPVKIIKNGRSNAVQGIRMLQSRSNGLNDVLMPKLNTVIVLNDGNSFITRRWNGCLNVVIGI